MKKTERLHGATPVKTSLRTQPAPFGSWWFKNWVSGSSKLQL